MGVDPAVTVEPTSAKNTTLIAMRHGGTHLIQPIIRQLTGRAVSTPKGAATLTWVPGPKLVIFTRDPRNRMVSHFRYKHHSNRHERSDAMLAKLMAEPKHGLTPIEFMVRWAERWCHPPHGFGTSFEQLMLCPVETVTRLRDYLDAPGDPEEAVAYTLGRSGTWTGRHSRWQEWFGPESQAEWSRQGGDRLVRLMGYD